jgi:hypothetical protein
MRGLIHDWKQGCEMQLCAPRTIDLSIEDWLLSVNPNLTCYAAALAHYGFNDVSLLIEATEEDIKEALQAVGMKKPHERVFLNGFRVLVCGDI